MKARNRSQERGVALIEYALLLASVSMCLFGGGALSLGNAVGDPFKSVSLNLDESGGIPSMPGLGGTGAGPLMIDGGAAIPIGGGTVIND